jgi:hypothetical protein
MIDTSLPVTTTSYYQESVIFPLAKPLLRSPGPSSLTLDSGTHR